jgi:hypothetical protein
VKGCGGAAPAEARKGGGGGGGLPRSCGGPAHKHAFAAARSWGLLVLFIHSGLRLLFSPLLSSSAPASLSAVRGSIHAAHGLAGRMDWEGARHAPSRAAPAPAAGPRAAPEEEACPQGIEPQVQTPGRVCTCNFFFSVTFFCFSVLTESNASSASNELGVP